MLMYETRGEAKFYYSYDANGTLYSVKYTLTDSSNLLTYYYTHNSRGDIVGIYNGAGQLRAHYEYDAWGNILSVTDENGNAITGATHIGNLNPFRYRGYYYDTESGFYYLMSRYYDPVTHRFVNADGYFQSGGDILDANMSAYCRNNPVSFVDFTGTYPTYSGVLITGQTFSGVPSHQLGYLGQVEKCWVDGEYIVVTKRQMKEIGFENVSQTMIDDLNSTIQRAGINSINEVAHFIAQCAFETNYGMWLTEIGDENYFSNSEYGYKYRGAGYIQLTWDYNYEAFGDYMGDPEIYKQGADYVAANYAWAAAGWFWSTHNIKNVINGANVNDVTAIINYYTDTYSARESVYHSVYGILG